MDADRLKWYVEAERVNGQWAMIAVAILCAAFDLVFSLYWLFALG